MATIHLEETNDFFSNYKRRMPKEILDNILQFYVDYKTDRLFTAIMELTRLRDFSKEIADLIDPKQNHEVPYIREVSSRKLHVYNPFNGDYLGEILNKDNI